MFEGLLAFANSLAAVGFIYWSWRQRGMAMLALAGWLLALTSVVLWSWVLGPQFGVTYAVIIFLCMMWGNVFLGREDPPLLSQVSERPYQALAFPNKSIFLKNCALFLLSVPLTGLLALMLSVAFVLYLPWTMLYKVAVAIFLYPVLWGALSGWICAQKNLVKPAVTTAGLFVISGLVLFI